ncbi:SEC-C domain-containing protein [uncultured Stenotrophomonas sp.]|uniref:YecA family protein n=1 Tax=uncultured Stenotrophomonas sp. TaxID=165438 RepID=UPI0025D9CBD2|nr:SEC-C domain-containing protein [uncultured Stenotrophomonas sp.]
MNSRVGRNQPCPCGSNKKFKRCHGGPNATQEELLSSGAEQARQFAAIHRIQLERQQGLGRGIISAVSSEMRLVVVGARKLWGDWKTFHDFLYTYAMDVIGQDWFRAEADKPAAVRHPIFNWHARLMTLAKASQCVSDHIKRIPLTGAINAYLTLAYDLYTLEHNASQAHTPGIKERLFHRLKHPDQFVGVRYEVRVAAMFLRAGFDLIWEDETDGTSRHCEFTATYPKTGRSFAVECKMRNQSMGAKSQSGFGKFVGLVGDALLKDTDIDRLVFVDINTPAKARAPDSPYDWRTAAVSHLRRFEGSKQAEGLPSALIFITNFPDHHHLDESVADAGAILEGFKTADYRTGEPTTIRQKIQLRERLPEVETLFASMVEHSEVPSTFEGEIPGLQDTSRLLIGHRYQMDDGQIGLLEDVSVHEQDGQVSLALQMEDGSRAIYQNLLSEDEFIAWKRYPETFFGDVRQRQGRIDDPMEFFDRMLQIYSQTPKEKLLGFMAPEPGLVREELSALEQPELATLYAEHITNAAVLRAGPQPIPANMRWMRKPPAR